MIELPLTIRAPRPDEMPRRADLAELLEKRKAARIVEGFTMQPNKTSQLPFSFYSAINVNNPRLWDLIEALLNVMPEEICLEYGLLEEEPVKTAYFPKGVVWQNLAPYRTELTQDGFIEFSLVACSSKALTEMKVTPAKYIIYCGSDKEGFLRCMADFQLSLVPDLAFIDEYPRITEPIKSVIPAAKSQEELIGILDGLFNIKRDPT